jgi:hypothetical protein
LQCDPYFDQVGCKHPGCEPAYDTPKCEKKCKVQNQVWEEKKHFSINAYRVSSDPHDIMAEVYKNGPVEVAFTVYEVNLIRFSPSYDIGVYLLRRSDCWLSEDRLSMSQNYCCYFEMYKHHIIKL